MDNSHFSINFTSIKHIRPYCQIIFFPVFLFFKMLTHFIIDGLIIVELGVKTVVTKLD